MNVAHVKIFFFILALSILVSCSMPRFIYNNIDTFLLYWFDVHFELRKEQRLDLKKKIEAFHEWHRKTELSKTVLILEELRDRYRKGIKW